MKPISILFILLFGINNAFCQLTVKPSSTSSANYIYVDGNLLFVSKFINLKKNTGNTETRASIYLRNEGQIIQGNTGASNTGTGSISVFQEGTSNAFDYNYWASPVGNHIPGNGLFGIQMLYSPENKTKSSPAIITNTLNGTSDPLTISSHWIYTYSGAAYSDWNYIGGKTTIPAGFGFSMKGVNGMDNTEVNNRENNPGNAQRYDFRGKPNNGTIEIPVSAGKNILIGNPYPSALDLSLFLIENSGSENMETECYGTVGRKNAITGIAYFWDSKENGNSHYLQDYVGGYGAFSPVAPCTTGIYQRPIFKMYKENGEVVQTGMEGKHYERRYAPIAQGFMVKGTTNTHLVFKNKHRIFKKEGNHSDFKRPEVTKNPKSEKELRSIPKIRLRVEINGEYVRSLSLAFWNSASAGIDMAMDAQAFNLAPTDVGWLLNKRSYIINVEPYHETKEIPLFLKVEGARASLKFSVDTLTHFTSEELYIHDLKADAYYPVLEHTFQISLDPGVYHNQFALSFKRNSKTALPVPHPKKEISIVQNNGLGRLEISNLSQNPLLSIYLFDVSGTQVFAKTSFPSSKNFNISTKDLANSIYIVKIMEKDHSQQIKKIVVLN